MKKIDIQCGGVTAPESGADQTIHMDVHGKNANVNLRIDHISRALLGNVPDILIDLLEVAAYVYCADQRVGRGSPILAQWGKTWKRELRFTIPVRNSEVWNRPEVRETLAGTLGFLSDDIYDFSFVRAANSFAETALYFPSLTDLIFQPDEVALFSGGIDSCAGAVDDLVANGKSLALIGHHSAEKIFRMQKALVEALNNTGFARKLIYVPVEVTNTGISPKDYNQRARSFLFAVLALVVARILGKDQFTFYENGVVSINLAFTHDILGGRATRTTHPKALRGLQALFSILLDRAITIRAPLQWQTKREVLGKLVHNGFEALLAKTSSCTRQYQWTAHCHHCGACSQCIDRRFAVLAASLAGHDPESDYQIDLLNGAREEDEHLVMAAAYVRFFQRVNKTTRSQFLAEFPQLSAAINNIPGLTAKQATDRIFDLYQRHASDVLRVIDDGLCQHGPALLRGELPPSALLSLCFTRNVATLAPIQDYDRQTVEFMDHLKAQPLEFAVDEKAKRILFRDKCALDGADYRLIDALLPNFRAGKKDSAEIAFIRPDKLAAVVGMTEPSMRQQVTRLRKVLADNLTPSLGVVFETNSFIENRERAGYRLNPALKEVAKGDL